jgi:hypothetical protein
MAAPVDRSTDAIAITALIITGRRQFNLVIASRRQMRRGDLVTHE